MVAAALRDNEAESVAALLELEVLDSEPEAEFDAMARSAAAACDAPFALISLVESDRQWFKANVGFEGVTQTARSESFCAHAILSDVALVVEDTLSDPRFAGSRFVTEDPKIRFYAGFPLILSNDLRIGTLCVMERFPRRLADTERVALEQLAAGVVRALEGRAALKRWRRQSAATLAPLGAQAFIASAQRNIDAAMQQLFAESVAHQASDRAHLLAEEPVFVHAGSQGCFAQSKLSAMHFCLTASVSLMDTTRRLLQPEVPMVALDRERAWKLLAEETKVAGRAAYRAALALSDPLADS